MFCSLGVSIPLAIYIYINFQKGRQNNIKVFATSHISTTLKSVCVYVN